MRRRWSWAERQWRTCAGGGRWGWGRGGVGGAMTWWFSGGGGSGGSGGGGGGGGGGGAWAVAVNTRLVGSRGVGARVRA